MFVFAHAAISGGKKSLSFVGRGGWGGEIILFASARTLVRPTAVSLILSLPSLAAHLASSCWLFVRALRFGICPDFRGALAVPGGPSSSAVPARRGPCFGLCSANVLAQR